MQQKAIITKKLEKIFKQKGLTAYSLANLINYNDSSMSQMFYGRKKFPENIIKKIAPILEVSPEEIKSWIVADKFPKELIELAVKNRKEIKYKRKSVVTIKIDNFLQEKGLSRSAFAKTVKIPQSPFNAMVIGKKSISPAAVEKIAQKIEVSELEIESWILADKYSLETLEFALQL